MTPVETLRTVLLATATVTDLVGQKIFAGKAPQGTAGPYVVIRKISAVGENTLEDDTDRDQLTSRRMQVDSFAARYQDAEALAEAVSKALRGVKTHGLSIWKVGERGLWDDVAQLHNDSRDFDVWS